MKLAKRKDGNYLLVKLNARDRKYLEAFRRKYDPPKRVGHPNVFLVSSLICIYELNDFKLLFVMHDKQW